MKNKRLVILLMALSTLAVLGYVGFTTLGSDTADNQNNPTPTTSETPSLSERTPVDTVTVNQVREHNTADDCWTIINDKVYDLTAYITRHPGGQEILRACGVDGTSLFTQRTTAEGQRVGSGTPHSTNAANQLENYYIADLST